MSQTAKTTKLSKNMNDAEDAETAKNSTKPNKKIIKPMTIDINGKKYYNARELKDYDTAYFFGCTKPIRKIIQRKTISHDVYLFATFNNKRKDGWVIYDTNDKIPVKCSLYLEKKWVESNVPKMKSKNNVIKNTLIKTSSAPNNNNEYREVPNILILTDDEKFKDAEGNIIEIETHGKRNQDEIYFLGSDVSKGFEIQYLNCTISRADSEYVINKHFCYFIIPHIDYEEKISQVKDNKGAIRKIDKDVSEKVDTGRTKKLLYITYSGMIKVLHSTRSPKAKTFQTWATKTLFTVQMGNCEQKELLAAGILGIPARSLKEMLSASATIISCVYCFSFGICEDLRKVMKLPTEIPNDYIIIKYGFTDSLSRRTQNHIDSYGNIQNVKLELIQYAYIDPKYLSKAEKDIKGFFVDIETPIKYEKFKELVAINPKHKKQIFRQFKMLSNEYSGCVKELTDKLEKTIGEYEKKLEIEKHEKDILKEKHKNELLLKDNNLLMKDNSLLMKDLEIEKLKNQILQKSK